MFKGVYVENNYGNNFSIADIVKTINIKDIETYVKQQMYRCQDQYIMSEIDDVIKSKVKNLVDELISRGYEVFNSGNFDSRQWLLRNQIEELQKHNKFLQHNVSQLQKQVNRLKDGGKYERLKFEFAQYKKSKQASYEAAQIEKNKAVNKLRDIQAILNKE